MEILVPKKTIEHLEAHKEVFNVLKEALDRAKKEIVKQDYPEILVTGIEFDTIVGKSGAKKVKYIDFEEETTFALRIGRPYPSRVVLGEMIDCNIVTVIAKKIDSNTYELLTAFIGKPALREPWDELTPTELEESLKFWSEYALIYDPEIMGPIGLSSFKEILEYKKTKDLI